MNIKLQEISVRYFKFSYLLRQTIYQDHVIISFRLSRPRSQQMGKQHTRVLELPFSTVRRRDGRVAANI